MSTIKKKVAKSDGKAATQPQAKGCVMSADPILRLPEAFGNLLSRWLREEGQLTYQSAATALGLPDKVAVIEMEGGKREPTLTQLFQLASTLRIQPALLFVDIIEQWRRDPTDLMRNTTRASDFARLYRLGYHFGPGDFRELAQAYGGMEQATSAARTLSTVRRKKGLLPLDTVLIYARLGYVSFPPDDGE